MKDEEEEFLAPHRDFALLSRRNSLKAPVPRRRQHHCPVCHKMASPRCSARGHYDECESHHNFYNPREGCVRCKGEVKRAEQQEGAAQRELAELERLAREASEAAKAAAAAGRKQASHVAPTQTTSTGTSSTSRREEKKANLCK